MMTHRSAARAAGRKAVTIAVGHCRLGRPSRAFTGRPAVANRRRSVQPSGPPAGADLRVRRTGRAVVARNGGCGQQLRSCVRSTRRLCARVVVPDLLGFGGSMVPPGRVSAEAHLDALDALDGMRAALGLAQEPLVVVGHSMDAPAPAGASSGGPRGAHGDATVRVSWRRPSRPARSGSVLHRRRRSVARSPRPARSG